MTLPQWGAFVGTQAVVVGLVAAFPRLGYLLYWPSRLSPRGLLTYVVLRTAVGFAVLAGLPWLQRRAEQLELARKELTMRLGREPTEPEIFEHLGWKH